MRQSDGKVIVRQPAKKREEPENVARKIFDFDAEFKLGIPSVDCEHMQLVDLLNQVHTLLNAGMRDDARQFFTSTLSGYVNEHFANEEQFMASIGFPLIEEHKKIHVHFRKSFQNLKPLIETADEAALRQALGDAFTWIITHIGKTDKKFATFHLASHAQ